MKFRFYVWQNRRSAEGLIGAALFIRINETAVRKFFGSRNPIGLTYRTRSGDGPWTAVEIIGVARDAKYRTIVATLTGLGLAVGVAVSLATGRFIATMLYGLTTNDPTSLLLAALTLAAVAVVAGYIPARRAAKVDPMECLRSD